MKIGVIIDSTIDSTAPLVEAVQKGGIYNQDIIVTLMVSDNYDPNPKIYYTIDGTIPTSNSTLYIVPINITDTTTLKFMAIDVTGNQAQVQTENYVLVLPVMNINTGKAYSWIQDAIDDPLTLSGHIIEVKSGTYAENIVVNKKITIRPAAGENVTIQALNSSKSVFTINSGGNSTMIQGFTIMGAISSNGIYLNGASNCNIIENVLTNNTNGMYLYYNSNNNTILNNTIANGTSYGIYISSSNYNIVQSNTITSNQHGIYLYNVSNSTIFENTITSNQYGIYLSSSSVNVNFNRIVGNTRYGLLNIGNGTVNATNNWWSSNNPTKSFISPSDLLITAGTVNYNPWLVLNVTASPASTNGNSTVTADLTHNSAGANTSSQGHVPENIPVNFITNMGTITNPVYTRNGQASATFNRGTFTSGIANITTTLDGQTVQVNVTIDIVAPTVAVNIPGGVYNTYQNVTLTATDNSFIVDATPIDLDYNTRRRHRSKEHLNKLDLKWSYASSYGFYIGFKATIVIEYESTLPVAILIHAGAPHDSKIFIEIMENLRKRRIIRKKDIIIFDKGYYSYQNYQIGISKYKIVPLIFPKDNFKLQKLDDSLTYPLNVFKNIKEENHVKKLYNN